MRRRRGSLSNGVNTKHAEKGNTDLVRPLLALSPLGFVLCGGGNANLTGGGGQEKVETLKNEWDTHFPVL